MKLGKALIAVSILACVGSGVSAKELGISGIFERNVQTSSPEKMTTYLKREAIIDPEPQDRADFLNYYRTRKATSFLGSNVLVFGEEIARRNVPGCCVDPGMELLLEVSDKSALNDLKRFAEKRGCFLVPNFDVKKELSYFAIGKELLSKKVSHLRCTGYTRMRVEEDRIEIPLPDGRP